MPALTPDQVVDLLIAAEDKVVQLEERLADAEKNAAKFHAQVLAARAELVNHVCPHCGKTSR